MFLAAILAAAISNQPLELRLICPGEYLDSESAMAQTRRRDENGDWQTVTTQVQRPIMRPGSAQVSFAEGTGELVYPNGATRQLTLVAVDQTKIVAEYQRSFLMMRKTWRLEINRLTGSIRVAAGDDLTFLGACSPEPTQPKF